MSVSMEGLRYRLWFVDFKSKHSEHTVPVEITLLLRFMSVSHLSTKSRELLVTETYFIVKGRQRKEELK